MAHEDTARELYEAIKPHVRVLTDGEMIAFNSHQIELLLVAALQAAEAEATERAAKSINDIGILLAQIDYLTEATGDGLEEQDARLVEQIRADHAAAIRSKTNAAE